MGSLSSVIGSIEHSIDQDFSYEDGLDSQLYSYLKQNYPMPQIQFLKHLIDLHGKHPKKEPLVISEDSLQ